MRTDWWDECRISVKQYVRAVGILKRKGLLTTKLYQFNGVPTVHLRLHLEKLIEQIELIVNPGNNPLCPNVTMDKAQRDESLTKNTNIDYMNATTADSQVFEFFYDNVQKRTSYIERKLVSLIQTYGSKSVADATKEAIDHNRLNLAYITKILETWQANGGKKPVTYDHPLEKRALERTLGVVLFQDQVNQLAIDVADFSPSKADQMRRAFGRRHNEELIKQYRREFLEGAKGRGVSESAAEIIFRKFNGLYMFPESHAFAFGVTAYQASWLKFHYPLEFFVGIFNQQPMGFYNLETLKEDAKRHEIRVLNPDVNKSRAVCVIEDDAIRLGFLNVLSLGVVSARAIEESRQKQGYFKSIGEFLERTGVLEEIALNLASAGAFDSLEPNRRRVKWEIGLRYRPINSQLSLPLPVKQDMVELVAPGDWESMQEEYNVLSLFPAGHIMDRLRPRFKANVITSKDIAGLGDGAEVMAAGLVIRRQRPAGKVVFITLEDEFGHIPLMVFPQVYERQEHKFKSPFLVVRGKLSRREGTHNVVVNQVRPFSALEKTPQSKDWR